MGVRGFIFSTDALLAVIIVIVLSGALLLGFQNNEGQNLGILERKAGDEATIAVYLGRSANDSLIATAKENAVCISRFYYGPDNGAGQASMSEKIKCEGFQ